MPRGKGPESYYTFSKAVHNLSSMSQRALMRVWDATAELAPSQRRDVMIEAFELISQGMGEVASAAAVEYYDSVGGTDGYKAKMADWFDRRKAEEDVRWAMGDTFRGEPDKSIAKMRGSMDKTVKGAARTTMTQNAVDDPRKPWVSIQTVGDTCKYCRERAGKWYRANGGFADGFSGFHANCDCHVAVSFDKGDNIEYTYRSDERGEELSEYTDAYGNPRPLANGNRQPPSRELTEMEKEDVRKDAESIGIPVEALSFGTGTRTSYDDWTGKINVRGDVLPDISSSHNRDRMTARAALAHEYYGHKAFAGTRIKANDWKDEFRASYRAAIDTPNLTDEERASLMIDAYQRASDAGASIRFTRDYMRIVYGY